jgi:CDP-diacylglycerol--glycerol-3-phosphate 3-phosphatidyltransferase
VKYVVNGITLSRIVMSVALLYFLNNQVIFITLYLLCGISDVLDGFLARKTNNQTTLGAKLDSIADFVMFSVILFTIFLVLGEKIMLFLPFVLLITIIRISSLIYAACKYKSFVMLHTYLNKLTGLLIFILFPIMFITNNINYFWFIIIIAILSALEEFIVHTISPQYDVNKKSIFY